MQIPAIIPMSFTIIEDPTLVDHVIDWSLCRSPSRAKRRQRLGYRQKTRIVESYPRAYIIGNRIICHPSIAQMIRDRIKMARTRSSSTSSECSAPTSAGSESI